ncbi:MAG TPA: hypothetical protein VMY69_01620 [Phycisphaerae bacterium]|nr:hypothetical protein [Phycisphaerae bacterium]
MAEPLIEQIVEEIAARVNEITKDAGFQYDLAAARPTRHQVVDIAEGTFVAPKDGTVIIIQDDPDLAEGEELAGSPAKLEWILPVHLMVFAIESDKSKIPIDRRLNRMRSDVEKKLREDPTRGGLAVDTRIRSPYAFPQNAQQTGVVCVVHVHFRTSEDDPYTQA